MKKYLAFLLLFICVAAMFYIRLTAPMGTTENDLFKMYWPYFIAIFAGTCVSLYIMKDEL